MRIRIGIVTVIAKAGRLGIGIEMKFLLNKRRNKEERIRDFVRKGKV